MGHCRPVDSPHKGPVMRKTFPFDDVYMNLKSCDVITRSIPNIYGDLAKPPSKLWHGWLITSLKAIAYIDLSVPTLIIFDSYYINHYTNDSWEFDYRDVCLHAYQCCALVFSLCSTNIVGKLRTIFYSASKILNSPDMYLFCFYILIRICFKQHANAVRMIGFAIQIIVQWMISCRCGHPDHSDKNIIHCWTGRRR